MAWLMRKSISISESPHVDWSRETTNEILESNAREVAKYAACPPGHPNYFKQGGVPVGLPREMPSKPFEAVIRELDGPLPDAITSQLVSSRIKAMIEKLEPGVHQFIPTVITKPSGDQSHDWWTMIICNRVDAIVLEQCTDVFEYRPKPEQFPDWYYYRSNEDKNTTLVVSKAATQGMAIWYDWRFQREFFSEELGQIFMREGVTGYCLPRDEINFSTHVSEV